MKILNALMGSTNTYFTRVTRHLLYVIFCLFFLNLLLIFSGKTTASEITKEEIAPSRKILYITTIYPYSSETNESLKGSNQGIPKGIALDPEGNLLAIFLDRMKIQVFNREGKFIYEFGEKGIGEGRYLVPLDIEISADGKVFILDSRQQKILIYDIKGRYLSEFSIVKGLVEGEKTVTATKMGLDRKNAILYISDTTNSVIRRFTLTGEYLDKFGKFGHNEGEFSFPGKITFDPQGNIYIIDSANARVQVYSPERKYKYAFGEFGDSLGEFVRPNAIVVDSHERIYVLDRLISAIQVFNKQGKALGVIKNLEGQNSMRDAAPFDMKIDSEDRIYISAQDFHSIKVIKDLE